MKKTTYFILSFILIQFCAIHLHAQKVSSVGTADNDVIVVVIESLPGDYNPPPNLTTNWSVNGIAPARVGRYTYVWDQEKRFWGQDPEWIITLRHHIYLKLQSALVSGTTYTIVVPGCGIWTLEFDDTATRCEAIKVNQVGYYGGSSIRYANFAIFNGDLGTRKLQNLPGYRVLDQEGTTLLSGDISYWGNDTNRKYATGEYIYRINLSALPEGGPYIVSVDGYGCSYPFGVGKDYVIQSDNTHQRGLYHQRCGIALEEPYTTFTRDICHTTVELTDAEPPDFITLRGTPRSISGGYHDAGDFDRRLSHTLIPASLLCLFEAYPNGFTDQQYNIPESGNGIPDFLDEALWGLKIWEELQEPDGAIRAGTEADGHPEYGVVNAATDDRIYKTFKRYGHTTAIGAGLFAHASRLVRPFDEARADELLTEAESAWNYLELHSDDPDMASAHETQRMYATLQLYLATGDQGYHDQFKNYASYSLTAGGALKYDVTGFNLPSMRDGQMFTPYFFSYLITDLDTDADLKNGYTQLLASNASQMLFEVNNRPYPIGANNVFGWGTATNQGRYADPMIMMYRLTSDHKYLDAVSQLADYTLGLNPLGRSYVTGLGANPPNNITHLDSYYSLKSGKGVVPGIVVYGPIDSPGTGSHLLAVADKVYPAFTSLPAQRRYTDGWSLIPATEFTTWETMTLNVCMYGFLSAVEGGGTLTLPLAPDKLVADSVSGQQVNLSWSDLSTMETSFRIERKTGESGSFVAITTVPENSTFYYDSDVTESTTYYYRVFALNGMGRSGYSNEVTVTTPATTTTPKTPALFHAEVVSTSEIILTWADISKTETGFVLEKKEGVDGTYTVIASPTQNSMRYVDSDLRESQSYFYRIKAVNSIGSSAYTDELSVTTKKNFKTLIITVEDTPYALDNFSNYAGGVTANSGYEVHDDGTTLFLYGYAAVKADVRYKVNPATLLEFDFKSVDEAWVHAIGMDSDNSTESGKTFKPFGKEIYWGNDDFKDYGGEGWQHFVIPLGKYLSGTMKYLFFINDDDDGVGMGYFKNIKIHEGVVPEAPGSFAATVLSESEITLSWSDNSDDEEGFLIERKNSLEETWSEIKRLNAGETSYSDTGLSSSSLYYYRLSAFNKSGLSPYSENLATTNSSVPGEINLPDAGTLGLWHLDNSLEDDSGNGFTLSLNGDAEFAGDNLNWMNSPSGAALRVYTVDDYATLEIPSTLLWPGNIPTTLEFWVYPLAWKAYSVQNSILGGLNQSWDSYFELYQGKWDLSPFIDCNNHEIKVAADILPGEWTHVALVFDGKLMSYYKNYALQAGPFESDPNLRSDKILLTLGNFDGYVDEVRISNVTRTYSEGGTPAAPENLTATAVSGKRINLSWTSNDAFVTGYKIERKMGSEGEYAPIALLDKAVLNYSDSLLTFSTTYYYRVSAFNPIEASSLSDEASATTMAGDAPPVAPDGLSATMLSSSEIQLNWTVQSDNEAWFRIERKKGAEGFYFQVGTADAGTSTFKSAYLEPSTRYYYRVRAYNEGGNSAYSNEAEAKTPLAAPVSLTAKVESENIITLGWYYVKGMEVGLIIERRVGSGGEFEELAEVSGDQLQYQDESVEMDIKYYYRIYAYNDDGVSVYSNIASATTTGFDLNREKLEGLQLAAYPNPFTKTTRISFNLERVSNVKIEIFDLTGRKQCQLLNETKQPGTYMVEWDARDEAGLLMPENLYLCRLTLQRDNHSFSTYKKLLIMGGR